MRTWSSSRRRKSVSLPKSHPIRVVMIGVYFASSSCAVPSHIGSGSKPNARFLLSYDIGCICQPISCPWSWRLVQRALCDTYPEAKSPVEYRTDSSDRINHVIGGRKLVPDTRLRTSCNGLQISFPRTRFRIGDKTGSTSQQMILFIAGLQQLSQEGPGAACRWLSTKRSRARRSSRSEEAR